MHTDPLAPGCLDFLCVDSKRLRQGHGSRCAVPECLLSNHLCRRTVQGVQGREEASAGWVCTVVEDALKAKMQSRTQPAAQRLIRCAGILVCYKNDHWTGSLRPELIRSLRRASGRTFLKMHTGARCGKISV